MNDNQRKMARKSGKACGYADGGIVGGVSAAIERVGRTFKTEKGKSLIAADEAVKNPKPDDKVINRISSQRAQDEVEKAEKGGQ